MTRDIDFTQAEQDDGYRADLEAIVQEKGAAYLHQMLAEVDLKSAEVIHENNTKRVIRALEFYHQNHSPISAHNEEQQERTSPYNLAYFVLNAPRELLYKRIDKRVDEMMTSGLVAEVQKLKDMGYHRGMVSMQGLGYKEIPGLSGWRNAAGRGCADLEARHPALCQTPAHLVPQRTGNSVGE